MNVSEILITVSLTVGAAVAIAYTTFKLQAQHRKRALFRALQSEIEYNRLRLDNFIAEWSMLSEGKSDYRPEAPILFTEAYEALRLSGELLKLPEPVRNRLNNTLSLIAIHNLRVSEAGLDYSRARGRDNNMSDRIDGIIKTCSFWKMSLLKRRRSLLKEVIMQSKTCGNDILCCKHHSFSFLVCFRYTRTI